MEQEITRLTEQFGVGLGLRAYHLATLSLTGQPCDVSFIEKKRAAVDVTIDQGISLALKDGAGPEELRRIFSEIRLSDGQVVALAEIRLVLPMPHGGLSKEELAAVDLSDGDKKSGPNGETVREIVRTFYRCESGEEEDGFLRRFLAC
ncbi:MAG: hypothetical protein WAU43_11975 [Acidobacteriaceae bacterium]